MTDIYVNLSYKEYKFFEREMLDHLQHETTHISTDARFYHKAFRFQLGDITLEVIGPMVPRPLAEAEGESDNLEVDMLLREGFD